MAAIEDEGVLSIPTEQFDATFYLAGDEDAGVGLACRLCDRGGLPIAYCGVDDRAYQGTDVIIVHAPTALLAAGLDHLSAHW